MEHGLVCWGRKSERNIMLDYAKPAVFLSSCLQYIFSGFPYHSLIDKQGTNLQSRHERLKVLLQQVQGGSGILQ